jgi:Icc-related predicted phosphoesterase
VLVLGDAHADEPDRREALLAAYSDADVERALQIGDLGYYELPIPTWFVAGNNEDFDVVEALRQDEQPDGVANAHLLASTAVELDGLRVGGLSGNFAPTQYDKPRSELSGDRRRHFTHEDVERAKGLESVDVLLAHEPPKGIISRGYDPGREQVGDLVDTLEPDLCLVGHHHQHAEGAVGGTRVVSLAPAWDSFYLFDPETLALTRHGTARDGHG